VKARRIIGQLVEMRGFSMRNGFLTNDSPPRFIPCLSNEDHLELAVRLFKVEGDSDPSAEVNRLAKSKNLGRLTFVRNWRWGQPTLFISFADDKMRPSPRQLRWLKDYGAEHEVDVILDAGRWTTELYAHKPD
jgi:hypothetical protein